MILILKIIGWTALVIIGIYVLFWVIFILLCCIGDAYEEQVKREKHLERYPDLSNFQYGRSWDPDHLEEFEESKRGADDD